MCSLDLYRSRPRINIHEVEGRTVFSDDIAKDEVGMGSSNVYQFFIRTMMAGIEK